MNGTTGTRPLEGGRRERRLAGLLLAGALLGGFAGTASAQLTTCKTPNCVPGTAAGPVLPQECLTRIGGQNLAAPRVIEVKMDGSLRFIPQNPRLEGQNTNPSLSWTYQCIEWHKTGSTSSPWHSATEDSLGSSCSTSQTCSGSNTYPSPCNFETGNIDTGTGGLEWGTCHYRDTPVATYPFVCRLHAGLGMSGQLQIVPPIVLTMTRNGADVDLAWTGGSSAGPWDVFRDATPGTAQKMASPLRLSDPKGDAARTLTDTSCTPGPGDLCAYMIRECNKDAATGNLCI